MCPPKSEFTRFALTTMARAFHRIMADNLASASRFPGNGGWSANDIVFEYGVLSTGGIGTLSRLACSSNFINKKVARSSPSIATSWLKASTHS